MSYKAYNRQSIRLKGYDYSRAGYYFVTMCTHNRDSIFGNIENGIMHCNKYGKIANDCWFDIPLHFPKVQLDEYIIMPNHVHGIIVINNSVESFGVDEVRKTVEESVLEELRKTAGIIEIEDIRKSVGTLEFDEIRKTVEARHAVPQRESLFQQNLLILSENVSRRKSDILRYEKFGKPTKKTIPTIIRSYKAAVSKKINELNSELRIKVWQRNYYEHIIRNETALRNIRKYIRNNPVKYYT
jgi:putative transposase